MSDYTREVNRIYRNGIKVGNREGMRTQRLIFEKQLYDKIAELEELKKIYKQYMKDKKDEKDFWCTEIIKLISQQELLKKLKEEI